MCLVGGDFWRIVFGNFGRLIVGWKMMMMTDHLDLVSLPHLHLQTLFVVVQTFLEIQTDRLSALAYIFARNLPPSLRTADSSNYLRQMFGQKANRQHSRPPWRKEPFPF